MKHLCVGALSPTRRLESTSQFAATLDAYRKPGAILWARTWTQPLRFAVRIEKLANSIPSLAIPRVCELPLYASGDLVIARRPRTR
jgi:hypothetical protein